MARPVEAAQDPLKFRCTGCGNCCRGTMICVTDADIRRIMEGTGRPAESFVRFVTKKDLDMHREHSWWVRFVTATGEKVRAAAILKWRGKACMFLDENERCTVYAHRPLVCRMHPFDVTLKNDETGPITDIEIDRPTECPNEWDGNNPKRDVWLLEKLTWKESYAYIERVLKWNRRRSGVRTTRAYLEYLFGPAALENRRRPGSSAAAPAPPPAS